MTQRAEILDVDLAAYSSGSRTTKAAIVDGVIRSLETGFVYTSHSIPAQLLDDTYGSLAEFFALDEDRKRSYVVDGTHGARGYTGVGVEQAVGAPAADLKEMFSWGTTLPGGHPLRTRYPDSYTPSVYPERDVAGITGLLERFHREIWQLQRDMLRIIAVGIGADESFFDRMTANGSALSRAINYPPMTAATSDDQIWSGAHADINLVTALPRATAAGLQVLVDTDDGGEWVDVAPPEQHVVINTGTMLEWVTNGMIPAGVHRVVGHGDDTTGRLSVVQFCHPAPWMSLAPISSCVTAERPVAYPGIAAGDLLAEVLYDIKMAN